MNSEQLRYFELAYQEHNFSAAARLVPCSPQGLAKAIHALEKELGVELFASDPASGLPQPTEYAHELYEYACVNDSNVRLLRESFDRIRGTQRLEVSLGLSLGVLGLLGYDFLNGFEQTYPGVRLTYRESDDAECARDLERGVCDLALIVGPPGALAERFAVRELYRCPIYLWAREDDPLAARDSIGIEDLAGRDVALPGRGFHCHAQLIDDAARAGVRLGRVFEMNEIFQLYEFALHGRGLGFTVRHLVDLATFTSGGVRAVPVRCEPWHFSVARQRTRALDTAERSLWEWCLRYARRLPSDPIA